MKTLYININSEKIESSDMLDVLEYDLINDFYFALGEKILTTCPVSNVDKIKLFKDYIETDCSAGSDSILEQWSQLKTQLFGEYLHGTFTVCLPDSYLNWLKYNVNQDYCRLAEKILPCIHIDIEEFYEDSIDGLKRRILRYLHKEDRCKDIDEFVFNDYAVARKSAIVRTIKEKYEDIGFISYEKWLREKEEILHTHPQVCGKCKKNPCECKTGQDNKYCYAIKERTEKGTTSIETYRFYNKWGALIDDGKYYLVSKDSADSGQVLHNLLVANANEDTNLYCFTPDGVFHKIGPFDLEDVLRSDVYVNKKYHRYDATIIQNRYILYQNHQKYRVYEIMTDYQVRKISEFNQKMRLVPEYIIGNYVVDIDDETINWETGEIVRIPKYNGGRILGIHNGKPIYLVSKNWSAQEAGYYNNCDVVDESGNFIWRFDYDNYKYCSDELLIVRRGRRISERCEGIVNLLGEEIVPCDCKGIKKISDDLYEITMSDYDHQYFIVSKNKVVSYLNDDYYAVLNDTEDELDIYSMESDKLLNSFSSDQFDGTILSDNIEEYILPYLYLDSYEYVLRSVSDNSIIYSLSEDAPFVITKDCFVVSKNDSLNIYDFKGNLLNTILDHNTNVVNVRLWENGYISLFSEKFQTGVWYDRNLVPHYCTDYIESENVLYIEKIVGDTIIIEEPHLTYFVRDNRCVCRVSNVEKLDDNNYYCADYDVRGDDNDWCVVNTENANVPIHFNVGCGYLIK